MPAHILIVDDDAALLGVFERLFINEGYEVCVAGDGEAALAYIKENQVDAAFLDLMLPGMNGLDLCRAIKQNNPITCCYAVTGHKTLFELAECREAGFEDYFEKPVRVSLLLDAARNATERIARWKSRA